MDRDKMLDLPGREIYTESKLFEHLKDIAPKRPEEYHITVRKDCSVLGHQIWISEVFELPMLGAYELTLEGSLRSIAAAIELELYPNSKTPDRVIEDNICPHCGEGTLYITSQFVEQLYSGHKVMVPVACLKCDHCDVIIDEEVQPNKGWTDYGC